MRFELHVIRAVTPAAHREFVIGDTLERLAEIERISGERAAARWLRRETWRVLCRAPHHRSAVRATPHDARRDSRGAAWLEFLLQDVRLAVRTLTREPVFASAITRRTSPRSLTSLP